MLRRRNALVCSFALLLPGTVLQPQVRESAGEVSSVVPEDLRCEYQENPLAIEAAVPRFSWKLKATDPAARGLRQSAYRILIASSPAILAGEKGDYWDSGAVSSSETIQILYAGKPLSSFQHLYWSIRVWDRNRLPSAWSKPAQFRMGLLAAADWKAKWIAEGTPESDRLPIFRRSIAIAKPIAEATAYVSGLGQYELRINGEKAGRAVLTPGWTDYRKTVLYNSYDLKKQLHPGNNALGILLGNGMYHSEATPGRYTKFTGSFGPRKLIFQARILFTDGTVETVISDSLWRWRAGPIVFSSMYGGEDYDARLEPADWLKRDFDDSGWAHVTEVNGPGGNLVAQESPAIEVERVYRAQRVTELRPGVYVYDLGQNFSGWPEVSVQGAPGTFIKIVPGELLDSGGFVSQKSSGGPEWFLYTLRGSGVETWHPLFSYYGFRYVQVEAHTYQGSPPPKVESVEGWFLHAAVPVAGSFKCSDELLNRIHRLIDAAILSNMQSVLTDCPHREKLGWLEEAHLLAPSIMDNYDVSGLYEKISGDMRDAQNASGSIAEIAPTYTAFPPPFNDSPEWGSAIVLAPWIAYRHYGSPRDLADRYPQMKRYTEYLGTKAQDGIVSYGLGDWYDVGPGQPGVSKLTSLGLTATAIYYADLATMVRVASVLGKPDEAHAFARTAAQVRQAFNGRFYDPKTHEYDRGSQTAYAMPLALGIVPDGDRRAVLEKLVAEIRRHNEHVTAGDIGFHFVVDALIDGGRSDVLYDMLSRTDAPSYGYQLSAGATSLTEAWDANPRSSQNHFMLGHAEEWFYRGLAGIDVDLSQPAASRIVIHPWLSAKVAEGEASYDSALGRVSVAWNRKGFSVAVPPNTTAIIYLPWGTDTNISESGRTLGKVPHIKVINRRPDETECGIDSGGYRFTVGPH